MAELYAAHAPYALRLAYLLSGNRELARDLVQEAFTKILGRFGDLRGPEAFQAYLRTTIINLSRKHFHRRVQERSFLQRESRSSIDRSTQLPNVEEQNEMWMLLQQLPHRQRAAIVLRYYDDLSEAQTADALGCSVGAAKQLVSRGMETLRSRMEGGKT